MSIKLMTRVYERTCSHSEQAVLLAMADHADDDGCHCFPSIGRIAWKTGYSERNVSRIVSALRSVGALVLVKEATRHRPNEYRIVLEALPDKPAFEPKQARQIVTPESEQGRSGPGGGQEQGRQDVTPTNDQGRQTVTPCHPRDDAGVTPGVTSGASRGDNSSTLGVTPVSPEPSRNHQEEPSRNLGGGTSEPPAPTEAAEDHPTYSDLVAPMLIEAFAFRGINAKNGKLLAWVGESLGVLGAALDDDPGRTQAWLDRLQASRHWRYRPPSASSKVADYLRGRLKDLRPTTVQAEWQPDPEFDGEQAGREFLERLQRVRGEEAAKLERAMQARRESAEVSP